MDVRLGVVLYPALVATVLGGVDGRHVRHAQAIGKRRGGSRHEPVVAVDQVEVLLLR